MTQRSESITRLSFPAVLALACLTGMVFFPVLSYEFIQSDVLAQVVHNPHIRGFGDGNFARILTSPCVTSYYPVRTLSYALDYHFWGLNPTGYKLTNVLIHLANVLLVFRLVLRLGRDRSAPLDSSGPSSIPSAAAAVAAALFAVHPVVVESVVWVSGREELLMTLGALGCLSLHLAARGAGEARSGWKPTWACYAGSTVCCGLACFSNAVAAVIPLLLTAWDLLMPVRPKLRDTLAATAGPWAIAIFTISIKSHATADVLARESPILSADRLMLVLNAYWLNIRSVFRPTELSLAYPRLSPENFGEGGVLLGAAALFATAVLLWLLRRQRLVLFGLVWFGIALGPTAQIMPHHIHRADRFLYLPLAGLVLAAGAGLCVLASQLQTNRARGLLGIFVLICLLTLAALSARQVRYWQDSVTIYGRSVAVAPDSPDAHRALADSLAAAGRLGPAVEHYEAALILEPEYIDVMRNLSYYLATTPDQRLRDDERAIELSERACLLTHNRDPGLLRTLAVARTNRAIGFETAGRFAEAIADYEKAAAADPLYELPAFNLAMILAICPEAELRDPSRAVTLAETALGKIDNPDPARLSVLAAAYASAGDFDRAAAAAERALRMVRSTGNPRATEEFERRLRLYQNGEPYRDPPPLDQP